MGVNLMEFGIYVRKGVMFTIKGCYRSVYNHPFFVCVVCALIYISRSYPFMFSLLVSASPVIVCTAVLLGTLLYYGQQNIHETEIEMKTKYEGVSLKNRMSIDANVVGRIDRHCVEKCGESKRDDVESSLLVKKLDEIRVGGGSVDGLSKERRSFGVESENGENWEGNGALGDPMEEEKGEWDEGRERERERLGDGEVMADHYAIISKVIGELLESESDHEKSEADSCDSERANRDEHSEDEGLDSGSDRGESSSLDDDSIEGIMPMLDERHPLLDEEGAQPPQTSRAASEAALTEQSPRSSISSIDETDIQESDAADDDDDDEAQDEKEDHTKSVITWTEEDQKNLMEVGNSEIERNQRLERILRRRKNRSMVPEINLMDFENSDFQFLIPPISTARQNPFDLPNDSLPGSAPSVLLQRRNPFDMPYDEDDPNEMAEKSREELKSSLSRQPFLRRRDNFTARPSIFSPNRQERRPVKLRPFFVAEQTVVDESSYSPFKRQSSGQSSVVETESVTSVEYIEDEKLEEGDDPSGDQDEVSNDQETADMTASSTLADEEVPNREPVYDTDTSPSAVGKNYSSSSSFTDVHAEPDKRAQGEVPSSSSCCDDRLEVEHSVGDGETVGAAYHEVQVPDTSSVASAEVALAKKAGSTSMEENMFAGTTPQHPEQGILDSVEGEK